MTQVTKESASQIAVEFLKKRKNTENIEVALIELEDDTRLLAHAIQLWLVALF